MQYQSLSALVFGALVAMGCSAPVTAGGLVAADARAFFQEPKYPGQAQGSAVSLVAEPEFKIRSKNEHHSATLKPFYRLDPIDAKRSHADLREASYRLMLDHVEAGVGVGTFTWGVLESYRPTDVLNQTDFVEAINGSAKLGQPFAEAGYVGESFALRLYYLPYFRERTFPGVRGRLRFPTVIDTDNPVYEPTAGPWFPSGAARFTFTVGSLDFGIGVFSGLSREPRFVAELTSGQVVPFYDIMRQGSVDLQWPIGSLTFKAEGFFRVWSDEARTFGGGGAGFDYTFFKVVSEWDLSVATEFLYDSRPVFAAPTFFDHDGFLGLRLAFNDPSSTEVLGGVVTDVVDGSTIGRLDVGRRFGDHWRVSVEGNVFFAPVGKLEGSFVKDNYVRGRLAYFF